MINNAKTCGNCRHWMKKPDCPREGGIGSQKGGPSCNATGCDKFYDKKKPILYLVVNNTGKLK